MANNDRVIPKKNYFILLLILIGTCGLLYYFYLWYVEYSNDRLYKPILNQEVFEIKYNEIDNYVMENNTVVIYASVVGDKKIRKFEDGFINLIQEYDLEDKILYLNLSDINNKGIINNLKQKYFVGDVNIFSSVPSIMVFENNILVDIYFVSENNYSVNKLENYLKVMNVIDVYD